MSNSLEDNLLSVISQATEGVINIPCDDPFDPNAHWTYYNQFSTKIEGKQNVKNPDIPTIEIKDYAKFLQDLDTFVDLAKLRYAEEKEFEDLTEEGFEKKLIMSLFTYPSVIDTLDYNQYIENQIKMLQSNIKTGDMKLGTYNGYNIGAEIKTCLSTIEGTHSFKPYITNQKEKFYLPRVCFSVLDDIVFVMRTHYHDHDQENPIQKQMDRHFRKVNKGVDPEDDISKVSPNALVSLTMFLSTIKQHGITKVVAPDYLPIKYIETKNKYINNKRKSEQDKEEGLKRLEIEQYNMTNRFMNLFHRYAYHFDNTQIGYDSVHMMMIMRLSNQQNITDNIIYDIDNATTINKPFISNPIEYEPEE